MFPFETWSHNGKDRRIGIGGAPQAHRRERLDTIRSSRVPSPHSSDDFSLVAFVVRRAIATIGVSEAPTWMLAGAPGQRVLERATRTSAR